VDDDCEGEFFSASEALSVRAPMPLEPRCGRCGLYRDCKSPKMKPSGRGRKRILICGDYPGKDEDATGIQFSGGAGDLLSGRLRSCGVSMRDDCWLTNSLICYSKGKPSEHKTAMSDCRPNLIKTIRSLNPEIIILLGTSAVRSLIGYLWKEDTGPIGRWVGHKIPDHKFNAWVCPSYNPAHLTYSREVVLNMHFDQHLEDACKLPGRPWPNGPPDYESEVEVIMSVDEATRRLERYTAGVIAFDYETNCLKPDGPIPEIVCASVCWEGRETIAFPWMGSVRGAMRTILENPNIGKIGANIKFEDRWTREKLGIEVQGWMFDTMLAAHAIDPRSVSERDPRGVSGLKFQAYVHLGCPDYSSHVAPLLESDRKGGYELNRIREVKLPQLLLYNGLDSLLEYKLAMIQMKHLGISHD
jgi:uracil-DNA glycosylase family 4